VSLALTAWMGSVPGHGLNFPSLLNSSMFWVESGVAQSRLDSRRLDFETIQRSDCGEGPILGRLRALKHQT